MFAKQLINRPHQPPQRRSARLRAGLAAVLIGAALTGGHAGAQQQTETTFDEYKVYYNVVNSTFLKPDVAANYDVTRGPGIGVLSVAVRAPDEDDVLRAEAAEVTGTVSGLVQEQTLAFGEFKEGPTIYYIAEFPFETRVPLTFSLEVTPASAAKTYDLEFTKTLYTDRE